MKSKIYFSTLLFILLFSSYDKLTAQAPNWQWAKAIGGNTYLVCNSTTKAPSGSYYATGYFVGTVDFDPGPGTSFLSSPGFCNIFISKMDDSGNLLWAKGIGETQMNAGYSIAIDDSENVYTTGFFQDTADFDPGGGTFNLISDSAQSGFISKLDSSGHFIWAKAITGATSNTQCYYISIDTYGNLFLTGHFTGTNDFDPDTGTYNLTSSGTYNSFILKLDNTGSFVWAKIINGTGDNGGIALVSDVSGNIFVSGVFRNTADFDPGPGISYLISNGLIDIFILKLDSLGNFMWVKSIGGTEDDYELSLTIDTTANDLYFAGMFTDSVDFDPGTSIFNLSSAGSQDAFICKLDSSGSFTWAKAIGGTNGSAGCFNIALDNIGNIYSTGYYTGMIDFDPGPGQFNLSDTGMNDAYILKLNSMGNFQWVKTAGGLNVDYGQCIIAEGNNNLFITGNFSSDTIIFDPDTLLNSGGSIGTGQDLFFAKISCNSSASINLSACINYTSPSGNYTWITSGSYVDTLINSTGCDSILTINLTINTVDTLVLQNGVTLAANATGATYQWLDCNNGFSPITGDTNQSFTASLNGNYAVAITQNGCTDTSACYTVIGVGINEISNEGNFDIFPNPAGSYCTLTLKNNMGSVIVTIHDITGNIIYKMETKSQKIKIITTDFADGIYFVQIQTPDFIETKKLIIAR